MGNQEATDAAFAKAKHVVTLKLINNRVSANPIEPRAALGDYAVDSDSYHALHDIAESAWRAFANRRRRFSIFRKPSCA